MVCTPSKFFIQKQNHALEMATQSLMGGSRPPLTKTSVTHVSKLVSTCVSTFWIHNFIINNPTKSYLQQTCTHSSNLTQNSRPHKSSTGGGRRSISALPY